MKHATPSALPLRLLLSGFGIFVFLAAFSHVTCVDIGFHIRTGAYILETGRIPSVNTFASTLPDSPWTLHQWWPGILFHAAYMQGGLTGLVLLKTVLALLMMGFALWAAGNQTAWRSAWPFWVATCGVLLARSRFYERPFFISAILFALLVLLELRFRADRRWQWIGLPLLLAFWANTHAGVIYGVIYVLIQAGIEAFAAAHTVLVPRKEPLHTASRGIRVRGVGILLASLAVWASLTWINPSGIRTILLPIVYFLDPFWQSLIQEFGGITWSNGRGFILACGVLLVLQSVTWRRIQWRLALPTLALAIMTFRSRRCIIFFTLAAIPYAAALLQTIAPTIGHIQRKRHVLYLFGLWSLLVLFSFVPDPNIRFGIGLYERLHPKSVYDFIAKQVPPQTIYNDMQYGADILWWLYPGFRPFIDGRCEAYPKSFWRDVYQRAERGDPEWAAIFERYSVSGALIAARPGTRQRTLPRLLHADPQWALVAFDDTTQFYLKRTATNQGVIATWEYRELWPTGPGLGESAYSSDRVQAEARRAFSIAPACRFAGLTAARCAFVRGDWQEAVTLYEKLLSLPGSTFSPTVYSYYGYALYRLDRFEEADRLFIDLTDQPGPVGAHAWFMRHYIAVRNRNFAQAIRFLDNAIGQDPANQEYRDRRSQLGAIARGSKREPEKTH